MNTIIKLLIIDDHPFFLEGLKIGLESLETIQYEVDTASSSQQALKGLQHICRYDLILCDLNLPDLDGIEFIRKLFNQDIWVPIAIISASENPADIRLAIHEGAAGFINKSAGKQQVNQAIQSILSGEQYVPANYSRFSKKHKPTETIEHSLAAKLGITQKQLEVLSYLGEGLSNREISEQMGVAISTVKSHTKALFQILNVTNRTACILNASRLKLIHSPYLVDHNPLSLQQQAV